jgi:acyl CoA:acetate/3-ketoacid CoA transferase alpha subunit
MNERSLKILEEGVGDLLTPIDLEAFRAHNRAKEKGLVDKRMSEKEAIRRFVDEGDYVGVELYGTVRCPMSLSRELVRGGYRSLRGVGQGVYESDLFAAADSFKALDWTYIGLEVYGVSSNLRRAVESGYVENIVEWSNAALAWRFKAAAMGVPFLPTRSMLGTDTLKYSAAKVVECPFTGEPICLLPALILDVGMIHVNRADKHGNCQIDGISGFAAEMACASKRVIVSAEEIVDTEAIRRAPDRTIIPWYVVDAVVEAPFGSHPGEMSGMYERDEEHISSYFESTKDVEKVKAYLDKWVYGVETHEAYLDLVGRERLEQLRIKGA